MTEETVSKAIKYLSGYNCTNCYYFSTYIVDVRVRCTSAPEQSIGYCTYKSDGILDLTLCENFLEGSK